jgi:hypothetical protein
MIEWLCMFHIVYPPNPNDGFRLWIFSCVITIITLLILDEMDHSWSHHYCNNGCEMGDELEFDVSLYC